MAAGSLHFKISLAIGAAIGILGVGYSTYTAMRGIGDGVCGASAFLFVFGLPLSLLEIVFENIGLVKGTWSGFIALSVLYVANWTLWGTLLGLVICRLAGKE